MDPYLLYSKKQRAENIIVREAQEIFNNLLTVKKCNESQLVAAIAEVCDMDSKVVSRLILGGEALYSTGLRNQIISCLKAWNQNPSLLNLKTIPVLSVENQKENPPAKKTLRVNTRRDREEENLKLLDEIIKKVEAQKHRSSP